MEQPTPYDPEDLQSDIDAEREFSAIHTFLSESSVAPREIGDLPLKPAASTRSGDADPSGALDQFPSEQEETPVARAVRAVVSHRSVAAASLMALAAVAAIVIVAISMRPEPSLIPTRTLVSIAHAPVGDAPSSESDSRAPVREVPSATTGNALPSATPATAASLSPRPSDQVPPPAPVPVAKPQPGATAVDARLSSTRPGAPDAAVAARSDAPRPESTRSPTAPVTPAVLTTRIDTVPAAAVPGSVREELNDAPVVVAEARVTPPAPVPSAPPVPVESRPAVTAPGPDRPVSPSIVDRPAPIATATPTAAIERTLKGYQAAFSRLDVAAVREVWPGVDEKALAKAFDQLRREDLTFDSCEVTVTGTTAVAACGGTTEYVPKIGSKNPRVERHRWRIGLHRVAEQWVVNRVDVSAP